MIYPMKDVKLQPQHGNWEAKKQFVVGGLCLGTTKNKHNETDVVATVYTISIIQKIQVNTFKLYTNGNWKEGVQIVTV